MVTQPATMMPPPVAMVVMMPPMMVASMMRDLRSGIGAGGLGAEQRANRQHQRQG
jgi:hypothetical protein